MNLGLSALHQNLSIQIDIINIWPPNHPQHNNFYVGILQLRAEEFPELEFPINTNLFQLLWCPRVHIDVYCATCLVFWRNEKEITEPMVECPVPSYPEQHFISQPCSLPTERIIEYPHIFYLQDQEKQIVREWSHAREDIYEIKLSTAPGVKVGGYPDWIHQPEVPICQCGRKMKHLLTIDDDDSAL